MSNHQQYTVTLKQMVGRVLSIKPNLPPTLATDFINDCIRVAMDRRPQWAGTVRHSTIYVPAPVTGLSAVLTQNSEQITVTGGTMPVDDLVNTTVAAAVTRTGLQTVVPASMTNITVDTLLYVDAGGNPEIVAVKAVTSTSFTAEFTRTHTASFTCTCSTYAGRQIKIGATYPVYTLKAVTSTTSGTIDLKWYATSTTLAFTLAKVYYTIDPAVKSLMSIVDQAQGIPPLQINKPVQYLDRIDPQRTALGFPAVFASKFPDENGNMQYELWPAPQSERQLTATWTFQPAILANDNDFLPLFLNPTVVFEYAAALAWGSKIGPEDQYFDPATANRHMDMFERYFNDACKTDDEKMGSGVMWNMNGWGIGGANWQQSHSVDAMYGPW